MHMCVSSGTKLHFVAADFTIRAASSSEVSKTILREASHEDVLKRDEQTCMRNVYGGTNSPRKKSPSATRPTGA